MPIAEASVAESGNAIDVNRGCERRMHPSGIEVWMYFDQPGVYYSSHGKELPVEIAEGASYPVKEHLKERTKRERLKEAHDKIEAQLGAAATNEWETVEERSGWKLAKRNGDQFSVLDDDGNQLNKMPLTADVARALFEQMAPQTQAPGKPVATPEKLAKPATVGGAGVPVVAKPSA